MQYININKFSFTPHIEALDKDVLTVSINGLKYVFGAYSTHNTHDQVKNDLIIKWCLDHNFNLITK